MKDWNYDNCRVRSKNLSGCLQTLCHVYGPLRNKIATLGVIPSRSDSDPLTNPVTGQAMLPTVSLTESYISGPFLKWMALKRLSGCVKLTVGSQHGLIRNWIGRRITV